MRKLHFELLRPEELIAERQRCPLVYLPIGPLEWHSLHLPYGADALNAAKVACLAAERTGGVVFPTLFFGTERERPPEKLSDLGITGESYVVGMDFPGHLLPSLYSSEELFALVVRDRLEQLVRLDYQLIVLVNGHGATNQLKVLQRLSIEFTAKTPAVVLLTFALPVPLKGGIAHADAIETSVMMAIHPESIDLKALPPLSEPLEYAKYGIVDAEGFGDDPVIDRQVNRESDPRRHAHAERGWLIIEGIVSNITALVNTALGKS